MRAAIRHILLNPGLDVQAKRRFKKYGMTVFDLSPLTCYSDSVGTTPCAKDDPCAKIICSNGTGIYATQATTGFMPKLRKGKVNRFLNSNNLSLWNGDARHIKTVETVVKAPDGISNCTKIQYLAIDGQNGYIFSTVWENSSDQTRYGGIWLRGAVGGEVVYISSTPDGINYRPTTTCALTTQWQFFTQDKGILNNWGFQVGVDLRDSQQSTKPAQTIYAAFAMGSEDVVTPDSYVETTTSPISNGIGPWWLDFDGSSNFLQSNTATPCKSALAVFKPITKPAANTYGLLTNRLTPASGIGFLFLSEAPYTTIPAAYAGNAAGFGVSRAYSKLAKSVAITHGDTNIVFNSAEDSGITDLRFIDGIKIGDDRGLGYNRWFGGGLYSLVISPEYISNADRIILTKYFAKKAGLLL